MKILHGPDLHTFPKTYGDRREEWKAASRGLLDIGMEEGVSCALFPGDRFETSKPNAEEFLAVSTLFSDFEQAGIVVVSFPGNHCRGASLVGPGAIVQALGSSSRWSIDEPRLVDLPGLQIAVLPWVRPAQILAEHSDPASAAGVVSAKLLEAARGLRAQCDDGTKKVLTGHWTLTGAELCSGQTVFGGTDPALPLQELLGMGWDAICMGHIHKPQRLTGEGQSFAGYAGNLLCKDFGEQQDSHGCWIIDLDIGEARWRQVPAARFHTVEWPQGKVASILSGGKDSLAKVVAEEDVEGAVVRVVYHCTAEQASQIDQRRIRELLTKAGASAVAGIHPDVERVQRVRDKTMTAALDPMAALEKYLAARTDVSEGLRGLAMSWARTFYGKAVSG